MKKRLISISFISLLVSLLTGCYFFLPLEAEAVFVNETDKTFYCMATYNSAPGLNDDYWVLGPGQTVTKTLKGGLTEFMYSDSTEYFSLYYKEQSAYESALNEHPEYRPWDILVFGSSLNGGYISATDKRSQNYRVVFRPDPSASNNILIELTW